MKVTPQDLNHRQLASKIGADLMAIEKNLDILYISGHLDTVTYTAKMAELAEYVELFARETWNEATDIVANDTENELQGIIAGTPLLPTKAEEYI